ncbi:hypothetical protein NKI98_27025 [Mesorhizobium sp. M0222]|uniref:hypothetical protein n=1 Tax=Mesorhizobium sp. M0222 TaxID=2956921 RepID=UPI0033369B6D
MKFVLTGRAPHLGAAGKPVEMTRSQAAYEQLRGHIVQPAVAKPGAAMESPKPGKGRKRT